MMWVEEALPSAGGGRITGGNGAAFLHPSAEAAGAWLVFPWSTLLITSSFISCLVLGIPLVIEELGGKAPVNPIQHPCPLCSVSVVLASNSVNFCLPFSQPVNVCFCVSVFLLRTRVCSQLLLRLRYLGLFVI